MQNPVSSKFDAAADASHQMDIDDGHATSQPQSTEVTKDLVSDPAIHESGLFSFFLVLISFNIILFSPSKQRPFTVVQHHISFKVTYSNLFNLSTCLSTFPHSFSSAQSTSSEYSTSRL